MRAWTISKLRLRSILQRRRLDGELDEELRHHIECATEYFVQSGQSPEQARNTALRSFGGRSQIADECRDQRRTHWFSGIGRDFGLGLRNLRRMPGFAAVVAVTLGLGIGANSAVFSIADGLLFRALPLPQPERLFQVLQPDGPGLVEFGQLFEPSDYVEMRDRVKGYSGLLAQSPAGLVAASIDGGPDEGLRHATVSENYFEVLGIAAAAGRLPGTGDGDPSRPPLAVISYRYWQSRFDRDRAVVGRTIRIGKTIHRISGVAPVGFSGLEPGSPAAVWTLLSPHAAGRSSQRSLQVIGRLNPASTLTQALAPLQSLLHQRMEEMVERAPAGTPRSLLDHILQLHLKLVPAGGGISPFRGDPAKPLYIVIGLAGLVLLMACATVAALFEARHSTRRGEMAVRMSLGSGRWRLLRQLLCEALLYAGLAAMVGLALARWVRPLLLSLLAPSGEPLQLPSTIDSHMLAFTVLMGVISTLLFALRPAWHSSAVKPAAALRTGAGGANPENPRRGRLSVLLQVGISMLLVLAAGAFVRTLRNLSLADVGFERKNVIVANVQFRGSARNQSLSQLWKALQLRAGELPGVESASVSSGSPFSGSSGNGMLRIPGISVQSKGCAFFLASPGFFRTTGMRLLHGRDLEPHDLELNAPPVAIVSEALVRQLFGGADPLGRTFSNFEDTPPRYVTIVGVVSDIRLGGLRNYAEPIVYLPYTWPETPASLSLVLRTRTDTAAVAGELRQAARDAHPAFAMQQIASQTSLIDESLARERMLATVGTFFGGIAVLMAIVGIYGITSYTASRRTPEIGIRMAVGASQSDVLAMILKESAAVVSAGATMGFGVWVLLERMVASFFFGTGAYDPGTLVTAAMFVLVVTGSAALIPAMRAARAEPMTALRSEWGAASLCSASPSAGAATGWPSWAEVRDWLPTRPRPRALNLRAATLAALSRLSADVAIFTVLVRHFFGRFFDKEALSPQGDPAAGVIQTLGLIAPVSGFVCLLLMIGNPAGWDLVGLRFLMVCYAMIVMGVVMVVEWDALLPDRRDYLILTPLPLSPFSVFTAKFAALGIFLSIFLSAAIVLGVLLWPGVETRGSFVAVASTHFGVLSAAGIFSALAVAVLQGVLSTVLRGATLRRISMCVQTSLMAGLALFLFLSPMMAMSIRDLCRANSPYLNWLPPFWFIGLYEHILPLVASDPVSGQRLAGLGSAAARSLWMVAALFTACYIPGYRRHARRALDPVEPDPRGPGVFGRTWNAAIARWLRDPAEAGVFHFIGQTILRSWKQRLFLGAYAGFGAALVLISAAARGDALRAPLALSFVLISGLRAVFNFPSDLRANWAFRVSEMQSADVYVRGTRKWVLACAVVPLFLVLAAIEALRAAGAVVVFHFGFGVTSSLVLMELLFFGFQKVPFTCAHFPGKFNLVYLSALYLFGFTFYSSYVASLEDWLLQRPLWATLAFFAAAALVWSLRLVQKRLGLETGLEYEGDGDPAVRTLDLTR